MKNMTFGEALEALKAGKKVARRGWNGKGMWLCIPLRDGPREIPAEGIWGEPNADYAKRNGGTVKVMPYITMKAADGSIVMGWLASQTDMLSDDWEIVGERQVENVNEQGGDDGPEDDENKAEALGKALGTMLAPLAVLGAGQEKLPEIHVNVWSLGK